MAATAENSTAKSERNPQATKHRAIDEIRRLSVVIDELASGVQSIDVAQMQFNAAKSIDTERSLLTAERHLAQLLNEVPA